MICLRAAGPTSFTEPPFHHKGHVVMTEQPEGTQGWFQPHSKLRFREIIIYYESWWKQRSRHFCCFAVNDSLGQTGRLPVAAEFHEFARTRVEFAAPLVHDDLTAAIVKISWRHTLPFRFAGQPEAGGVATAEEGDGGAHWPVADTGA